MMASGSPGRTRIARKMRIETPSSVGIAIRIRFAT
jgi:hypothetical protein